jgi:putative cell wall-binding protein/DNA-binding beta-propeller fold protein YncE
MQSRAKWMAAFGAVLLMGVGAAAGSADSIDDAESHRNATIFDQKAEWERRYPVDVEQGGEEIPRGLALDRSQGRVYTLSRNGEREDPGTRLAAYEVDNGDLEWESSVPPASSLTVDDDGDLVYVAHSEREVGVAAYEAATGDQEWHSGRVGHPELGADGTILTVTDGETAWGLDAVDGETRWETEWSEEDDDLETHAAMGPDGETLFLASDEDASQAGKMVAIEVTNGDVRWEAVTPEPGWEGEPHALAAGGDGAHVYVMSVRSDSREPEMTDGDPRWFETVVVAHDATSGEVVWSESFRGDHDFYQGREMVATADGSSVILASNRGFVRDDHGATRIMIQRHPSVRSLDADNGQTQWDKSFYPLPGYAPQPYELELSTDDSTVFLFGKSAPSNVGSWNNRHEGELLGQLSRGLVMALDSNTGREVWLSQLPETDAEFDGEVRNCFNCPLERNSFLAASDDRLFIAAGDDGERFEISEEGNHAFGIVDLVVTAYDQSPTLGKVRRIGGSDRFTTAAEASRVLAAGDGRGTQHSEVFVAAGGDFPDALAGGAVAGRANAPLLLATRDDLPEATEAALDRLGPGNVTVLGGTSVISESVNEQAQEYAHYGRTRRSERLAGDTRFATAAEISASQFHLDDQPVAYVASGADFPDALSAGTAAARQRGPVLLTAPEELPTVTAEELERLQPAKILVVGGSAAVSEDVEAELRELTEGAVYRLSGADRYATSAELSREAFPIGSRIAYVASGEDYPDALAGAPAAAASRAPLLLVAQDSVPDPVEAELGRLEPSRIVVLGGTASISDDVVEELRGLTTP